MGLRYRRAASAGVNLTLLSGEIHPDEVMAYYAAIDETDAAMAGKWITCDCGDADLSELDLARVAQLKALIGSKITALSAFQPLRSAIVSGRQINEPFFRFWQVLVSTDANYLSAPQFFHALPAACDWLGLDAAGQAEVSDLVAKG